MRITQSVLSASDTCMLRAQYTLDKPEWVVRVSGSTRAVGTAYHAGLEHLYRKRMAGEVWNLTDMMVQAVDTFDKSMVVDLYDDTPVEEFKWDEKVPDQATAVALITSMLTEYVRGGHVWPDDWKVLAVEHNEWFDDPDIGPGVQTKLGCDLVLEDPNGWVVAVDHKTAGKAWAQGKEHPRKNVQAPFYLRGLRKAFPNAPGYRFVFDVMCYPTAKIGPRFERRISDPEPRHEHAVAVKARSFAAVYNLVYINQGVDLPANPSSTLCNAKWCDFFSGCSFGAPLEDAP